MPMRRAVRLGLVWIGLWGWVLPVSAAEPVGVWITFGHRDEAPAAWRGHVEVVDGHLTGLRGWHFEADDRITGNRFEVHTRRKAARRKPESKPVVPCGLIAEIEGGPDTRLVVDTAQGKSGVRLAEIPWGVAVDRLEGNLRFERVPPATVLPPRASAEKAEEPALLPGLHVVPPHIPDANVGNSQEDLPAVAVTGDGTVWIAWTSYFDKQVDLRVASSDGRNWSKPTVLVPSGDIAAVALAAAGRDLWCVWAAQVDGNWDLYARRHDGAAWLGAQRLTNHPGADLFPRLATGSNGRVFLAWQAVRDRESRVQVSWLGASGWAKGAAVDRTPGNQWFPAIAADAAGGAWVAWDAYRDESYDVRLAHFKEGRIEPPVRVADTSRFEANAGIAAGPDGRVAVAWEESPPNWGKDFGQLGPKKGTTGLYPGRVLRVAVYRHGEWFSPAGDVNASMPEGMRKYLTHPQPFFGADGRLWVSFRRRNTKYVYPWPRGIWETYLTCSNGAQGWTRAVYFPGSAGGCAAAPSLAAGPDGRHWFAWASDLRPWRRPIPFQSRVAVAALDLAGAAGGPASLAPRRRTPARPVPAVHPNEREDVARVRSHLWRVGDRAYRLYRGNLHRHTDLSWDATIDGSLLDLYRYGLDAAHLDFIASTEHVGWGVADRGNGQYAWWRNEQLCDAFLRPGHFLPLYAYERSMHYPFGHRNILAPKRGVLPVMAFLTPEGNIAPDDTRRLYRALRQTGSLAMAHTTATAMGTDWADNDPAIEPLVEIYQGCRRSYEKPGAPRAAKQAGKFGPGFIDRALAKGYKLGFQASSDHWGTHMSYVCLYATEFTRAGLLEAIRRRHAYGATDNILLEFSARDEKGTHLMGDSFRPSGRVVFDVDVIGTAPIARVVVIRSGEVVHTTDGDGTQLAFRYADMADSNAAAYYYIRVEQKDGQLAWASPIWIE